ncbi:MAG: hypothetical protein M0027_14685 [Candidatus Dormibacteraeota bacterium]|nr:hypothetical protein [Candidatus Dormibacteraeota bacterium]
MKRTGRAWWRAWINGSGPSPLSLLVAQGDLTEQGMRHFATWSATGAPASSAEVRRYHLDGYTARRTLLAALQQALSTPLDQEDIFTLSERLDRVLDEAKDAVRESEVLNWSPDAHVERMGRLLADGTSALAAALRLLPHDMVGAGSQADASTVAVRHVEHRYREAMTELLQTPDLRTVLAAQDVYRRYVLVAGHVVSVADRLWYSVLRGG